MNWKGLAACALVYCLWRIAGAQNNWVWGFIAGGVFVGFLDGRPHEWSSVVALAVLCLLWLLFVESWRNPWEGTPRPPPPE